MASGVNIDCHEGFGLVHDDVAAALEVNLPGECVLQLAGDVEPIEDRLGFNVKLDLVKRTG